MAESASSVFMFAYIIFILGLTLWSYRQIGKPSFSMSLSIVSSSGILGTFIGITLGLIFFDMDPERLQESTASLINSLRFAFITSIFSIASSMILKRINGSTVQPDSYQDSSHSDRDLLVELRKAISDDSDSSLCGQIKHLRVDLLDSLAPIKSLNEIKTLMEDLKQTNISNTEKVSNEIRGISEQLTQKSVDSLVSAISEVMDSFNAKINDQLGQNFKDLSESVSNLNHWQKENMNANEKSVEIFGKLIGDIERLYSMSEESQKLITQVAEHAQIFHDTSHILKSASSDLSKTENSISKSLTELNSVSSKAQDLVPTLNSSLQGWLDTTSKHIKESQTNSSKHLSEVSKQLIDITQQNIKDSSAMTERLGSEMESLTKELTKNMKSQLEALDKSLENQLNESLSSLGNNLAGISEKFTLDYASFAESLANCQKQLKTQIDNGESHAARRH